MLENCQLAAMGEIWMCVAGSPLAHVTDQINPFFLHGHWFSLNDPNNFGNIKICLDYICLTPLIKKKKRRKARKYSPPLCYYRCSTCLSTKPWPWCKNPILPWLSTTAFLLHWRSWIIALTFTHPSPQQATPHQIKLLLLATHLRPHTWR